MKNQLFLLASFLLASFSISAQNKVVVIDFNYSKLNQITSSADLGNLFPINQEQSFINIGHAKIGILDNKSGSIMKKFDEATLLKKLTGILNKNYSGIYSTLSPDEFQKLPLCQRHPFIYQRFYKINSKLFACEVWCVVKNLKMQGEISFVKGIGYFSEKLELIEFYEREEYDKSFIVSRIGGFFVGKDNFYIKKAIPEVNEGFNFIHFQLKNEKFQLVGELKGTKASSQNIFFPGRFLSMFTINENYYINNGSNLIKTKLLGQVNTNVNLRLKKNEVIGILNKVNNNQVIGLRLELDEEGAAHFGTLFSSDPEFKTVKDIYRYDQLHFRINSIEVYQNEIYLFIYDKIQHKYLLEIKTIKNLN